MNDKEPIDYSQPVAYDVNGRPLYAHPPAPTQAQPELPILPPSITVDTPSPSINPVSPTQGEQSSAQSDAATRHEASRKRYPHLNLSKDEYVIAEVGRHLIGLAPFVGTAIVLDILGAIFLIMYPAFEPSSAIVPFSTLVLPITMVMALASLIAYAAYVIYTSNRFFLTNESVIEESQNGLFAKKERTVGLANIEEVTFGQKNVFQSFFNYGTIRLSIEGDHNAYRFAFVENPKKRVDLLVNTIEERKAKGGGHH